MKDLLPARVTISFQVFLLINTVNIVLGNPFYIFGSPSGDKYFTVISYIEGVSCVILGFPLGTVSYYWCSIF